jgi:hypothetical protein
MPLLKLIETHHWKTGVDEIAGLAEALEDVLRPVQEALAEKAYWDNCTMEETEYKSRDGFIPYKHNCGGREITLVVPSCEQYAFGFLSFGECDECGKESDAAGNPLQCGFGGQECGYEAEGHLDAKLRVWLKFEGLENGVMQFWLYMGGGNGDAPYFRTGHEATVFEQAFTAKSLAGVRRQGAAAVRKLLKVVAS